MLGFAFTFARYLTPPAAWYIVTAMYVLLTGQSNTETFTVSVLMPYLHSDNHNGILK